MRKWGRAAVGFDPARESCLRAKAFGYCFMPTHTEPCESWILTIRSLNL